MAALTRADIDELAELARLGITDDEAVALQVDLGAILAHVATLTALDLAGVPAMTDVASGPANALRADVVAPSLPVEVAVGGARVTQADHFVVPAAIPGGAGE